MKQQLLSFIAILTTFYISSQNLPNFVTVKGGTFAMGNEYTIGDDDEKPVHKVTLSTFKISKTEITVAQYLSYCKIKGINMPETPSWGWKKNHPIVNISWYDAMEYCHWLSKILNKKVTLPTEAQWEFAARGGNNNKGYKYSGKNNLTSIAWFLKNSNKQTHPVTSKKANKLGLYGMSGNVWEWCLDWYNPNFYSKSPSNNPENIKRTKFKLLRGGGFNSRPFYCRVTFRHSHAPYNKYNNTGFRVVIY